MTTNILKAFKALFTKPSVHLVIGPTGVGKSTYAKKLAQQEQLVRFSIDEWMVTLFGKDRPVDADYLWYKDRIDRATEKIWNLSTQILALGMGSVLEIGLTQKADREAFYQRVISSHGHLTLHVLEAPVEVRWDRVTHRNNGQGETFSMEVTRGMFDFVEGMWEPPEEAELERWNGRVISTYPSA